MGKKLGKGPNTIEQTLRAMLELAGWQAELARAGLRQIAEPAGRGRGRPGSKGKSGSRR